MEDYNLLQPLLQPPATTSSANTAAKDDAINLISSNSGILFRVLSVFFIGIVTIWANCEASKGFSITIINDAGDTAAGRKFDLFYVSNDKATRMVLNTSEFVEKVLYDPSNTHPKKDVNHVIVRLASRNLTHMAIVSSRERNEFALDISPSVMQGTHVGYAMASALQRGMARIWLWDGEDSAPPALLEGMVEYITILAGFSPAPTMPNSVDLSGSGNFCWMNKDPIAVAHFLNYCEAQNRGFIQRLNQAMEHQWHEGALEAALGFPVQDLCASYNSTKIPVVGNVLFSRSKPLNI